MFSEGECNGSSDSTQFIHQCDQNFNDSQMYISAVNFPLVFMFSVRRQMSPVSARRVAFVFRDFPIGFILIISNDFTLRHYVRWMHNEILCLLHFCRPGFLTIHIPPWSSMGLQVLRICRSQRLDMGLKRVSWVRRYQGQCRALQPLGHQGYRLRNYKEDPPLSSGYNHAQPPRGAGSDTARPTMRQATHQHSRPDHEGGPTTTQHTRP